MGVCTCDAENWDAKAGEGAAAASMVSRDSKSCWTGNRDVSSGLEHPHIGHGRCVCSCGSGVTSLIGCRTGSPSHGLGSGAVEKDASSLKAVSVELDVPGLGARHADVGRRRPGLTVAIASSSVAVILRVVSMPSLERCP